MPRTNPEIRTVMIPSSNASSSGSSSYTERTYENYRRSFSSVKTPGWSRPKKRDAPFNDYEMNLVETEHGVFRTDSINRSGWSGTNGGGGSTSSWSWSQSAASLVVGLPTVISPNIASLLTEASTKALLNLKSQKVNLMQVYGERQQTLRMISSAVQRISQSFSRLRRFDILGAADALGFTLRLSRRRRLEARRDAYRRDGRSGFDFAAKSWLEYVYGWTPLLQDIHGSLEKWVDYQNGRPPIIRVVGTSKEEANIRTTHTKSSTLNDWSQTHMKCRMRVIYEYSLGNSVFHNLSSFGVTNPASLAWELLPFSFVVDWFLPIGDFLSSLDAEFGMTYRRGVYSVQTDVDSTRTYVNSQVNSGSSNNGSIVSFYYNSTKGNGTVRRRQFRYLRARLLTSIIRLPTVKDPFSVRHTLNGLALLKVTFGR